MKDIKKTLFMKEAASGKSHNILVEICIAVLLFFIASVAMGLVQIPALTAYLLSNEDYMSMLLAGRLDTQKMLSVFSNIPEWIMIVMLFAEILLIKYEGIAASISPLYIIGYFLGYLLQGMAEEVLCRGYLMVSLSRRYHVTLAITASSLFFAFLHSGNSGVSSLAFWGICITSFT